MFLKYLLIFFVAMLPIIELRGAIPIGVGMELDKLLVYVVALIGNLLPVPLIYLFARKVLNWGKDKKLTKKFFTWCLSKGERLGEKLTRKAGGSVYIALFLFVAIPLPGTGAWTGTLAASILNLDFKKTTLAVLGGVLIAGLIMMAISFGVFDVIFG